MKRLQFTLRQLMMVTGPIGVALGLLLRAPDSMIGLGVLVGSTLVLLGALGIGIALLARAPFWLRFILELAALLLLLTCSAWIWRPAFYVGNAERCEQLAVFAAIEASRTERPESRAALRRESEWFGRQAASLRWTALWYGLIEGPASPDRYPLSDREFIRELSIDAAIEAHERALSEIARLPRS